MVSLNILLLTVLSFDMVVKSLVAYYSIRLYRTKSEKKLIISSYLICLITDGQTEGGLTSIQPEGRSVVSSLLYVKTFNLHLELFGGTFSLLPYPFKIHKHAPPPPSNHTHTHAPSTTTVSRSRYLISLSGGLLI